MTVYLTSTSSTTSSLPESNRVETNSSESFMGSLSRSIFTELIVPKLDLDCFYLEKKFINCLKKQNLETEKWSLFFEHLNEADLTKAEKFLILRVIVRSSINPIPVELPAQFLASIMHLKSVSGIRLIQMICEAEPEDKELDLAMYVDTFRLLTELYQESDLITVVRKCLPSLSSLVIKLQEKECQLIAEKYPERSIDEVIKRFESDITVQFPLSSDELNVIKDEYLQVKACVEEIRKDGFETALKSVKDYAKAWKESKCKKSKYKFIALILEGIRHYFEIFPYDTQVLAFLALINTSKGLKGRIAQIKTGEGKSTMTAMQVVYHACQGSFVDVITSSSYLAIRDCKKYENFFKAFGCLATSISHENVTQENFHGQILFGINTDFEFALLRDGLNNSGLRWSYLEGKLQGRNFDNTVAIVDEVDNLFLDSALNSALMSISSTEDFSWVYSAIIKYVADAPVDTLRANKMRAFLLEYLPEKHHSSISAFTDERLVKWLESARMAHKKVENYDYVIYPNSVTGQLDVGIMDYRNTGRLQKGSQWKDGLHQLLQAKHQLTITSESLTAASLAHPSYFALYKQIIGMTGTMGEKAERKEIEEIYEVDTFDVPTHFPSQRETKTSLVFSNSDEQQLAIIAQIEEMIASDRPTLVLFESAKETIAFSEKLTSCGIRHHILNELQREKEDYIIAKAGDAKSVTVATNMAGRGTDIILSPKSKNKGGLHLIFTFFPSNIRSEAQGFGRAGRQGQKGSCIMMLDKNHSSVKQFSKNLSETDQEILFDNLAILRSYKNEIGSKLRSVCSKMERIFFAKQHMFFQDMKKLCEHFENPSTQTTFYDNCMRICSEESKEATSEPSDSLEPLGEGWNNFKDIAKKMMHTASKGVSVDWTTLFKVFKSTYILEVQKIWATFYDKLHDTKDNDLDKLNREVEKRYTEVKARLEPYFLDLEAMSIRLLNNIGSNCDKIG